MKDNYFDITNSQEGASPSSLPTHILYESAKGVQPVPLSAAAFERGDIYLTGPIDDDTATRSTMLLRLAAKQRMDINLYIDLCPLDTLEMREMTKCSDFDIKTLADEKTALFVNVSDTDRSKDIAINILYTQIMDTLSRYADSLPDKYLLVPVRFILDDFGSASKIEGFENIISNKGAV